MSYSTSPAKTGPSPQWRQRTRVAVRAALLAGCIYLTIDILRTTASWLNPRVGRTEPAIADLAEFHWRIPRIDHSPLADLIDDSINSDYQFSWKRFCGQVDETGVRKISGATSEFNEHLSSSSMGDIQGAFGFRWADLIEELLPPVTPRVHLCGTSNSQSRLLATTEASLSELCDYWSSRQWKVDRMHSPAQIRLTRGSVILTATYWNEPANAGERQDELATGPGFIRFDYSEER